MCIIYNIIMIYQGDSTSIDELLYHFHSTLSGDPVLHQIITALHVLPHNFEGARLLLLLRSFCALRELVKNHQADHHKW